MLTFIQVGVGPFLAIYLQCVRNWTPTRIGMVLGAAGLAGMLAQMPLGALIDRLHHRRELYALGAVLAAAGSVAIVELSSFPQILLVGKDDLLPANRRELIISILAHPIAPVCV